MRTQKITGTLLLASTLVSCANLHDVPGVKRLPGLNGDKSTSLSAASYRALSIQESRFSIDSNDPNVLLLGSTNMLDGDNWIGADGVVISLRNGRVTQIDDQKKNRFWAYAIYDPIDSWISNLAEDSAPPSVGSRAFRQLVSAHADNKERIEERRLISIVQSMGDSCPRQLTSPCWIVIEQVSFGSQERLAKTFIDAISHQVIEIHQPLPDGYGQFRWTRLR